MLILLCNLWKKQQKYFISKNVTKHQYWSYCISFRFATLCCRESQTSQHTQSLMFAHLQSHAVDCVSENVRFLNHQISALVSFLKILHQLGSKNSPTGYVVLHAIKAAPRWQHTATTWGSQQSSVQALPRNNAGPWSRYLSMPSITFTGYIVWAAAASASNSATHFHWGYSFSWFVWLPERELSVMPAVFYTRGSCYCYPCLKLSTHAARTAQGKWNLCVWLTRFIQHNGNTWLILRNDNTTYNNSGKKRHSQIKSVFVNNPKLLSMNILHLVMRGRTMRCTSPRYLEEKCIKNFSPPSVTLCLLIKCQER